MTIDLHILLFATLLCLRELSRLMNSSVLFVHYLHFKNIIFVHYTVYRDSYIMMYYSVSCRCCMSRFCVVVIIVCSGFYTRDTPAWVIAGAKRLDLSKEFDSVATLWLAYICLKPSTASNAYGFIRSSDVTFNATSLSSHWSSLYNIDIDLLSNCKLYTSLYGVRMLIGGASVCLLTVSANWLTIFHRVWLTFIVVWSFSFI